MRYIAKHIPSQGINIYKVCPNGDEYLMCHMRWTDGLNAKVEENVKADASLIVNALNSYRASSKEGLR